MRSNKGFSLVELLVAMVVFVVVLGAAMSFLVMQSRTFRRGSDDMGVLQNMSFGADNLDGQLRTAGSNTVDQQPVVVYASDNTFAFNTNYVTNDTLDIFAVYFDPDAPAAQVEALKQANQITIPGSSPAWNYPSAD
jgi:prepilin-type N-terminal cleavage/methylation domain-containing protein